MFGFLNLQEIRETGQNCLFDADYNKQFPGLRDGVSIESCIASICHDDEISFFNDDIDDYLVV